MTFITRNRFKISALVFFALGITISTQAHTPVYYPPKIPVLDMMDYKEAERKEKQTEDTYWLARTGHGEASGLTEREEEEVLAVIMNRVESPKFPNTVQGVVLQNRQFSMYNIGNSNKKRTHDAFAAEKYNGPVLRSIGLGMKVYGQKPSERILPTDVLHYHSKAVKPKWSKGMPVYSNSGAHIFYGGGFNELTL